MIELNEKALLRRCNRKLAKAGRRLIKSRPGHEVEHLGAYYVLGAEGEAEIVASRIEDLVAYAQELGVAS